MPREPKFELRIRTPANDTLEKCLKTKQDLFLQQTQEL